MHVLAEHREYAYMMGGVREAQLIDEVMKGESIRVPLAAICDAIPNDTVHPGVVWDHGKPTATKK